MQTKIMYVRVCVCVCVWVCVQGNVLEISAGTGRNFPYYHYPDIDRLTITDVSRPMLTEAEKKVRLSMHASGDVLFHVSLHVTQLLAWGLRCKGRAFWHHHQSCLALVSRTCVGHARATVIGPL